MFQFEIFRKEMYCIEESIVTLLGLFGFPRSDSLPVELCPLCPPRYAPECDRFI